MADAGLTGIRKCVECFVDRLEYGGRTWQATAPLMIDRSNVRGNGVIQPALWEPTPSHVHMVMRSGGGRICRCDSQNFGRSWSIIYPTDLPNNKSGIDLAELESNAG